MFKYRLPMTGSRTQALLCQKRPLGQLCQNDCPDPNDTSNVTRGEDCNKANRSAL